MRFDKQYWIREDERPKSHRQPSQSTAPRDPGSSKDATSRTTTTNTTTTQRTDTKPRNTLGLNSAGHLTPEQRQERFDKKLCMYCGGAGHMRANCPIAPPMRDNPRAKTETTKTTTTQSSTTPRVGRVVITVPADEPTPTATIAPVEEEVTETTSENK